MATRKGILGVMERAGLTPAEAQEVFDYYVRERIVRVSAHDGAAVIHGVFLETDVVKTALRHSREPEE